MRKILIIEDDENSALALVIRLKAHGFATATASDAISGLSMAVRQRLDLILLDIAIPGGDGFTLRPFPFGVPCPDVEYIDLLTLLT